MEATLGGESLGCLRLQHEQEINFLCTKPDLGVCCYGSKGYPMLTNTPGFIPNNVVKVDFEVSGVKILLQRLGQLIILRGNPCLLIPLKCILDRVKYKKTKPCGYLDMLYKTNQFLKCFVIVQKIFLKRNS